MKILVINPHSYIHSDIMEALNNIFGDGSADELEFLFKGKNIHNCPEFEVLFEKKTKECTYNFVLSTNFYPIIARLCNDKNMLYLAWTYDTPMNVMPCDEMRYETNYIFLFDRMELDRYKRLGYERFYHMPLGVNTKKYERFQTSKEYSCEISFLGKLYRSNLPIIKQGLSDDMTAYLDKIVSVQKNIFGQYVVDELISQSIVDEMNREYKISKTGLVINKEQLSYAIAEYVTYLDRMGLLEVLGRRYDVHLFTYDIGEMEKSFLTDVKIHDPLDYNDQMPLLFKSSKINLSSSLRAARSAISLRALDILGIGGFLLSNAQPELEECFEEGREVVLFRSIEEAVDLAGFYLKHDEQRRKIAAAGLERVKNDFRYEDRIIKMLNIAKIKIER